MLFMIGSLLIELRAHEACGEVSGEVLMKAITPDVILCHVGALNAGLASLRSVRPGSSVVGGFGEFARSHPARRRLRLRSYIASSARATMSSNDCSPRNGQRQTPALAASGYGPGCSALYL